MIVTLINEGIFSLNQIPDIRNATLALDIGYALALGLEKSITLSAKRYTLPLQTQLLWDFHAVLG